VIGKLAAECPMENTVDASLPCETAAWCERAEEVVRNPPGGRCRCAELAREGVLLRRRWDRIDPDAPDRRRLLRLLPAVQSIAQRRLTEGVEDAGRADADPARLVVEQLVEDDQYVVGLLNDPSLSAESAALAVECFRDDLHWLGTQVAALEGSQGVDFLGRVLLEQEALEREIDAWEDAAAGQAHSPATVSPDADQLRRAARRLRQTALARQIDSLVNEREPEDWAGWHRIWQAASRLASRLGPEPNRGHAAPEAEDETGGPLAEDAHRVVEEVRARAQQRWSQSLDELPPQDRRDALKHVADGLADAAGELLTFLEDTTLPEAVRGLEVLEEDVTHCLGAVKRHRTESLRGLRGMLRRRRRAVAGELQERRLAWRMEGLFGRGFVVGLERLILFLLVFFVIMLAAEGPLLEYEAARGGFELHSGQSRIEPVFAWMDLGICVVFLMEFSLKMTLARRRWLYVRRNWFTGLLPAIPVGFFAYATHRLALAEEAECIVLLRGLRYLRLPRMARWLRIARPALRIARLVGFVLRASDRLVRQLTPLLNRNLVVFERAAVDVQDPVYRTRLSALRERFYYRAVELIHDLPESGRSRFAMRRIEDLTAMLSAPAVEEITPAVSVRRSSVRETRLERVIAWLLAATPAGISDRIGRTLAYSVARWCRAFDVFAVRRLPLVRDLVAAGRLPSPYDTTAQVANQIGVLLSRLLDRVYWVADLYGTVTAPQLVDSMGEYMVKGSARPARRLVVVGVGFLAVTYLASLLSMPKLSALSETLRQLVGWPLVVLGGLCLAVFGLGVWFRRIAGEATEFYTQVAQAQFITATKRLKRRLARPHHAVLHRRVIAPELALAGHAAHSGEAPADTAAGSDRVETARAAVELLWRDYLDGSPFHADDIKPTTQLLGNLVLVSLRQTRLKYNRRRTKMLRRLDLGGNRMSMRGPYLWFHFISRSVAQQTAKLVVDYNAFALPLCRGATAGAGDVLRYVEWLGRRLRKPVHELELPPPFRERFDALVNHRLEAGGRAERAEEFHGNDFTAMHFLSADKDIEAEVRRRYGDQVADLMRRDRRDNIRRVLRTYPFQHWPKERRTFNPLTLYQRHLAGGRVLLLPVKMAWWAALALGRAIQFACTVVQDVLNPTVADLGALEDSDPFEVAVRKIHRMRKPLFLACLEMRAEFDPEYLGVVPPGTSGLARGAPTLQIEDDLAMIRAEPGVKSRFRRLAGVRRRQMLDFRRWLDRFGAGGYPAESLRAMAIAYSIDYRGVRSRLEAVRLLERAFGQAIAPQSGAPASGGARSWSLSTRWRRRRLAEKLDRLFRQPAFAGFDDAQQAACRRVVCRHGGLLVAAVRRLTEDGSGDAVDDARRALLHVARDPDTWSRQLVILRAVQTLSVLDLKTYCDVVAELGEYDASTAEDPNGILP